MPSPPARDIIVVHSSDLHVDHDYTARLHGGDGTAGLACVLGAARDVVAQEALPQAAAACPIVPARLGARIGDVAALMAGLSDARVLAALGVNPGPGVNAGPR